MSVYFISGIDTDIGKSVAVGMMARDLHRARRAGHHHEACPDRQRRILRGSRQASRHDGSASVSGGQSRLTAPQIFRFPASPHLAALLEKRELDLDAIRRAVTEVSKRYDVVLLEGAGGLAVPLTEELLTVDFAAELGCPLILVTSGRLGSLNHTILSIEAAASRGMVVAGTVYNRYPAADPTIDADSPRMIRKYLKRHRMPEVLVELPKVGEPLPDIDFSAIFGEAAR